MDRIGIVPENPEILCRRFQSGKPSHRLVGIGIPLRVGILGHTPDSLHCRILIYVFFNQIHIRPALRHGNIDHLNAELLRYGKMPVISRNRAKEFHFVQLRPGGAPKDAKKHTARHRIIHNVQTGIAKHNNHILGNTDHVGH